MVGNQGYMIGLNTRINDNNAFYDPITRLHLTRMKPADTVMQLSQYIMNGLRGGTLVDVYNNIPRNLYDSTYNMQQQIQQTQQVQQNVNTQPVQQVQQAQPTQQVQQNQHEDMQQEQPQEDSQEPAKKTKKSKAKE